MVVERRKEALGADPLFEISLLRFRTFRYGLITAVIIALGQLGLLFALPLFLQGANGLSAEQNGLWMLPLGLSMIVGAQVGGRLNHRFGTTNVVRFGFFVESFALVAIIPTIHPGVSFWQLLPCLTMFGLGVGAASGPLTNLVLVGDLHREVGRGERRQQHRPSARRRPRRRRGRFAAHDADHQPCRRRGARRRPAHRRHRRRGEGPRGHGSELAATGPTPPRDRWPRSPTRSTRP